MTLMVVRDTGKQEASDGENAVTKDSITQQPDADTQQTDILNIVEEALFVSPKRSPGRLDNQHNKIEENSDAIQKTQIQHTPFIILAPKVDITPHFAVMGNIDANRCRVTCMNAVAGQSPQILTLLLFFSCDLHVHDVVSVRMPGYALIEAPRENGLVRGVTYVVLCPIALEMI